MNNYAYLLFNAAIALTFLIGPFIVRTQFWQRWRNILFGLGAVSVPFILWDVTATYQDHWNFNERFTLDVHFLGLPLEEMLFFVIVPLACMFVWSVIEKVPDRRVMADYRIRGIFINAALVMVAFGIFVPGLYTSVVLLAAAITCAMLLRRLDLLTSRRFWLFQVVAIGLFVMANSYLTGLPIVTYNDVAISGFKLGTIPIEDFLYNFALLNLFLLCFLRGNDGTNKKRNPKIAQNA